MMIIISLFAFIEEVMIKMVFMIQITVKVMMIIIIII